MSMPVKVLDLYCCAGGASSGFVQAGCTVVGVDIEPRKNYPFEFVQSDAIEYVLKHGYEFDYIHASPPCQKYSCSTAVHKSRGSEYPDLVAATRDALERVGKPYDIENVISAPVRRDIILRGEMFGLKVIRKRVFELGNWFAFANGLGGDTTNSVKGGSAVCIYGSASWKNTGSMNLPRASYIPEWRKRTIRETWAYAMGIDHYMSDREIAEAIPPAYTKYIIELFMQYQNNKSGRPICTLK